MRTLRHEVGRIAGVVALALVACALTGCAIFPEIAPQKEIYRGTHPVRVTNASSADICEFVFLSASRSHARPGSYLDEPLRAGESVVFELRKDKFGIGVRPCNDSRAIPAGLIDSTTAPEIVLLDKDGTFEGQVAPGYALHGPYYFHKEADAEVLARREMELRVRREKTQSAASTVAIIHNRCDKRARLFLGSPRAFLRGQHFLVGPQARRSVRGQGQLWLLDEQAQPVARLALRSTVRHITIAPDCTTLTPTK